MASAPKRFSSYRLSVECHDLLGRMSTRTGLSRAAVIEMAVRRLARRELGPDQVPGKSSKKGGPTP